MDKNKKLYRSEDRLFAGVCSGIAEYFGMDPTIVRVLWVILSVCSAGFPGLLIYIICAAIIPSESKVVEKAEGAKSDVKTDGKSGGKKSDAVEVNYTESENE